MRWPWTRAIEYVCAVLSAQSRTIGQLEDSLSDMARLLDMRERHLKDIEARMSLMELWTCAERARTDRLEKMNRAAERMPGAATPGTAPNTVAAVEG